MEQKQVRNKIVSISLILLVLCLAEFSRAQIKPFEVFPFPWGTECPFPWSEIEGVWEYSDDSINGFIKFYVKSERGDGSRIFGIEVYDRSEQLIAQGHGVSEKGQRIVRAAVHPVDKNLGAPGYWVIVRTYAEEELACSDSPLVTAMTFRPLGDDCVGEEDIHFRLRRVQNRP